MKALYNISYGVYVLTAKDEKVNGCIINTLLQVTSNPVKISITVNKDNYTTKMIEKTGKFNVSILDKTTKFDIIERFGFSSGKNIDKFEGFSNFRIAENGIPFITKYTNSYLSASVVSATDVGTHVTFVAEVDADVVLNQNSPITYAEYINNIKPKPQNTGHPVYVCRICGYEYKGEKLPENFVCPTCKHGVEVFELKGEQKMAENTPQKVFCPVCGYEENADKTTGICVICGAQMNKKQ